MGGERERKAGSAGDTSPFDTHPFLTTLTTLHTHRLRQYDGCLFHKIVPSFIAQTGDPTGTGRGGDSADGVLYGPQARFFAPEIVLPKLTHAGTGCVGMAPSGTDGNASQFYITLAPRLHTLDGKHTLFGVVAEGLDVLQTLSEVPLDNDGRPLQNVRIRKAVVLDDPFPDPPSLAAAIPEATPPPRGGADRLEDDWTPPADPVDADEAADAAAAARAAAAAVVLEMVGDLPSADVAPPDTVLFVCKLNPVTREEDLDTIFSRFGRVTQCAIVRDLKTGDSLCYGFVGFDTPSAAEAAYFKMNGVLIDDRRIRCDFSQSVAHLWRAFRTHGREGGAGDGAAAAAAGDAPRRGKRDDDGHGRSDRHGRQMAPLPRAYGGGGGEHGLLLGDDGGGDRGSRRERDRRSDRDRADRRPRSRSRDRDRDRHATTRREDRSRSRDRYARWRSRSRERRR